MFLVPGATRGDLSSRWRVSCLAVTICFLLLVPACLANGIYYPEQATPQMPSIPVQRALITYRDGVETLVVESALTSRSTNVGWVLPVPAEPTQLACGDPDMLRVLSAFAGPRVVHDLTEYWSLPVHIVVGVVPLVVLLIACRRRRWVFTGLAIWLFAVSLVLPSLTRAGTGSSDGIAVSAVQRIGPYEITTLRAKTPDDLSAWLTGNGLLPLPQAQRAVVADYIQQGWTFLVTRLAAVAGEQMQPPPIVATFPTPSCTFPMRLTQFAGSIARVELFIVARDAASAAGFRRITTDSYQQEAPYAPDYPLAYIAGETGITLAIPDITQMLWPGCSITRLDADLAPAEMSRDVTMGFAPAKPERQRLFSPRGRLELAELVILWGALPVLVTSGILFRGRRRPTRARVYAPASLAVATILAAVITIVAVPVTPIASATKVFPPHVQSLIQTVSSEVALRAFRGEISPDISAQQIIEQLPDQMRQTLCNPVTRGPLKVERTPGNISIRRSAGQTWFCMYDDQCREYATLLTPRSRLLAVSKRRDATASTKPAEAPAPGRR
jgi:hypothetical protein